MPADPAGAFLLWWLLRWPRALTLRCRAVVRLKKAAREGGYALERRGMRWLRCSGVGRRRRLSCPGRGGNNTSILSPRWGAHGLCASSLTMSMSASVRLASFCSTPTSPCRCRLRGCSSRPACRPAPCSGRTARPCPSTISGASAPCSGTTEKRAVSFLLTARLLCDGFTPLRRPVYGRSRRGRSRCRRSACSRGSRGQRGRRS